MLISMQTVHRRGRNRHVSCRTTSICEHVSRLKPHKCRPHQIHALASPPAKKRVTCDIGRSVKICAHMCGTHARTKGFGLCAARTRRTCKCTQSIIDVKPYTAHTHQLVHILMSVCARTPVCMNMCTNACVCVRAVSAPSSERE